MTLPTTTKSNGEIHPRNSTIRLTALIVVFNIAFVFAALPFFFASAGYPNALAPSTAQLLYTSGCLLQLSADAFMFSKALRKRSSFPLAKLVALILLDNVPFGLLITPDLLGFGHPQTNMAAMLVRVMACVAMGTANVYILAFVAYFSSRRERTLRNGAQAMARVVKLETIRRGGGEQDSRHDIKTSRVKVELEVLTKDGLNFRSNPEVNVYNPLPGEHYTTGLGADQFEGIDIRQMQPGMQVPVRYDRSNHKLVYIDTQAMAKSDSVMSEESPEVA